MYLIWEEFLWRCRSFLVTTGLTGGFKLIVSRLSLVGRIDRIHSTLSTVTTSLQSEVVWPSSRHDSNSSQTNIVTWWDLSDDNDLMTALIVALGWNIFHGHPRFSHNCFSDRIWTWTPMFSMFLRYSLMLESKRPFLPPKCVTITRTDFFFSLQWLTLILTVSTETTVFPVPQRPHKKRLISGFATEIRKKIYIF